MPGRWRTLPTPGMARAHPRSWKRCAGQTLVAQFRLVCAAAARGLAPGGPESPIQTRVVCCMQDTVLGGAPAGGARRAPAVAAENSWRRRSEGSAAAAVCWLQPGCVLRGYLFSMWPAAARFAAALPLLAAGAGQRASGHAAGRCRRPAGADISRHLTGGHKLAGRGGSSSGSAGSPPQ